MINSIFNIRKTKLLGAIVITVSLLSSLLLTLATTSKTYANGWTYGWQTWTIADISGTNQNNGNPFWNNLSQDGVNLNVGDILSGANGNTDFANPPGALPYWGSSISTGGHADPNVFFSSTGSSGLLWPTGSGEVTVKVVHAGNASSNVLGWYNVANASALNQLFNGAQPGATISFTPSAQFGLYFIGQGDTFHSQTQLNNSGEQSDQHFAIFKDTNGNFWVGCEDALHLGDIDYNDLVVEIIPSLVASPTVTMSAVVGGSGQAPTICAKFETPDDLSATPGTQFNPTPGALRPMKFYVLADDPNGVNDIAAIDIAVFYPTITGLPKSGLEKFNAQAQKINGTWTFEDAAISVRQIFYNTSSDWVDMNANGTKDPEDVGIVPALGLMNTQSRLTIGAQTTLGTDNTGIIHDVEWGKQIIMEITVNMDPCQNAEIYDVYVTATDMEGNTTTGPVAANNQVGLHNQFEYLSATALVIDFTSINWGNINVGAENLITGDNDITTANAPTVQNLGNDRAEIQLYATPMTGALHGKQIKNFDAKMNNPALTDLYGALPRNPQLGYIQFNAGNLVTINEGVDITPAIAVQTTSPVVLSPCSTAQIDFSIFPSQPTIQDSYSGTMTISIKHWQATETNPVYSVMPTTSN